jgi:uncharacterized protein (TIGR03437 family)
MKIPIVFCALAGMAYAQTGAVVGAGYNLFAPLSVAPGQVITVFVTGIGNVTQKVSAGSPPLPDTLAGVSTSVIQGLTPLPAGMLAVFPLNPCLFGPTPAQCGTVTAITLQIPFEMRANIPGTLQVAELLTYLQVSDNAGHTASIMLNPVLDAIHVLHSQDTVLVEDMAPGAGAGSAVVTHADGTAVDALHPAQAGEQVVMYAVGLGATIPPVKTGTASPLPPAQAGVVFTLNFDYRPNATPSPAFEFSTGDPAPIPSPAFVGLTPGFVGLYQINFRVPAPPAGVAPCVASLGFGANPFANVLSNLTVTLTGRISFDGAAICVAPAAP